MADLRASKLPSSVIAPSGFFSDMGDFLAMARSGRVWLFGDGAFRINPIHGADLAVTCVDALDDERRGIDVGGPETLTWREVAAMAFQVRGKPVKITTVPRWFLARIISLTRVFSRHKAELMAFFTTMGTRDVVGPPTGTHTLDAHFRELEAAR